MLPWKQLNSRVASSLFEIVKGDPCREDQLGPPIGAESLRARGASGWLVPLVLFCPKCGLCVSPSIPVSGQVPWGLIGWLGPGQAHPGVSIETADPGCEFLVQCGGFRNLSGKEKRLYVIKEQLGLGQPLKPSSWAFAVGEKERDSLLQPRVRASFEMTLAC